MLDMATSKFNRLYILKLETGDNEFVEIESPFTLEFTVTRNNLASANTAHFVIYNLSPKLRSKIYKDQYDIATMRAIQLFAGYGEKVGDMLPRIFNGNIKRAYSQRSGADFRTEIEAYDGQISTATSTVSTTLPSGATRTQMISTLVNSLKGVAGSTIGSAMQNGQSKRGTVLSGNPMELLNQLTGGNFYVDNQSAYVLAKDEVITGDIKLISNDNGLIGTPKKTETLVEITMLFEPRLKPSQLIELQSLTEPRFNGYYKVVGFTHRGVISGALCGEALTIVQMVDAKTANIVVDKSIAEYKSTSVGNIA